jgi:hypothetical protein
MNTRRLGGRARLPALFLTVALLGVTVLTSMATPAAGTTTTLLSDHDATEGGMQLLPNLAVTAGGRAAHALWTENSGTSDGYKLFSRRMPLGDTVEISGHLFEIYHPTSLQGRSDADGRACFVWAEQTATSEGSTLFFWDSAGQTSQQLSPDDLTEGDVAYARTQVLISSDDSAYVLWDESTGSFTELFLWSEGDGGTVQLSDSGLPAGSIEGNTMVEGGGAIHVAWSEWTGPTSYHDAFYWDSISESVRNLSPANDTGIPGSMEVIVDTTGVAHLLWGEAVTPPESTCPLHWDAATDNVQNLAGEQGGCAAAGLAYAGDDIGGVHASWIGDPDGLGQDTIYYWSTAIPTTTVVVTDVANAPQLVATPGGTAHLAWIHEEDIHERTDLYHWDSVSGEVSNISDNGLTTGYVSDPRLASASSGQVFIVWSEEVDDNDELTDLFLWDSTGVTTTRLSEPATVSGSALYAQLQVGGDGVAHVLWEETSESSGGRALYYWNSSDATLIELGPTTNQDLQSSNLLDPDDHVHVVWVSESGTGEGEDVGYWNAAEGAVVLSDLEVTEGDVSSESLHLVQDGQGHVYVVWSEQSGTSEGYDLFGAWVPVELGTKVYLPLVVR